MAEARATLQALHVKMSPPLQLNENAIEEWESLSNCSRTGANRQSVPVCSTSSLQRNCRKKIFHGLEFAPAGPGNNIAEDNDDIRTIIEKFD